jgi:hypothetical protein
MQIHTSSNVDDGELRVHMNPGSGDPFGVLCFTRWSGTQVNVESDEDADRLIRAATRIKEMRAAISRPHAYECMAGEAYCTVCGLMEKDGPHEGAAAAVEG